MIGNPGETEADLKQTLGLIRENQFNPYFAAATYITTPLPGTALWEEAIRRGVIKEKIKWDDLCMDIPDNIAALKKAPLLTDLHINEFYRLSQLFKKEDEKQRFKNYKLNLSPELIKRSLLRPKDTIKFLLEILKAKLISPFYKKTL